MLRLLVVTTLAACNVVFPLRDPDAQMPLDASPDAVPGHDEDSDGTPDLTDNCPNLANDQDDGDRDEVGDACDPDPVNASDRIAFFDPFTAFDGNRWSIGKGDWGVETDRLEQRKVLEIPENYLFRLKGGAFSQPTIDLVIADIGTIDAGAFLITGDGVEADPGYPDGVICYVVQSENNVSFFEHRVATAGFGQGNAVALVGTQFPVRLRMRFTGSTQGGPSCKAQRIDGQPASFVASTFEVADIATAEVGIYAYHSVAAFSSIVIYDKR